MNTLASKLDNYFEPSYFQRCKGSSRRDVNALLELYGYGHGYDSGDARAEYRLYHAKGHYLYQRTKYCTSALPRVFIALCCIVLIFPIPMLMKRREYLSNAGRIVRGLVVREDLKNIPEFRTKSFDMVGVKVTFPSRYGPFKAGSMDYDVGNKGHYKSDFLIARNQGNDQNEKKNYPPGYRWVKEAKNNDAKAWRLKLCILTISLMGAFVCTAIVDWWASVMIRHLILKHIDPSNASAHSIIRLITPILGAVFIVGHLSAAFIVATAESLKESSPDALCGNHARIEISDTLLLQVSSAHQMNTGRILGPYNQEARKARVAADQETSARAQKKTCPRSHNKGASSDFKRSENAALEKFGCGYCIGANLYRGEFINIEQEGNKRSVATTQVRPLNLVCVPHPSLAQFTTDPARPTRDPTSRLKIPFEMSPMQDMPSILNIRGRKNLCLHPCRFMERAISVLVLYNAAAILYNAAAVLITLASKIVSLLYRAVRSAVTGVKGCFVPTVARASGNDENLSSTPRSQTPPSIEENNDNDSGEKNRTSAPICGLEGIESIADIRASPSCRSSTS